METTDVIALLALLIAAFRLGYDVGQNESSRPRIAETATPEQNSY